MLFRQKYLLEMGELRLGAELGVDQSSQGPLSGYFYYLVIASLVGLHWERGEESEAADQSW